MKSTMMLAFAITAMAFTGTINAQDCGSCGTMPAYGGGFGHLGGTMGGYQGYGGLLGPAGPNDCGRGYTQQQAASLWGGYCTESCVARCGLFGGRCGLRGGCNSGGCGGFASAFGYPGNGGLGCSQGCFGYPMGGACCGGGFGGFGGFGGCRAGGGFFSKILGHFHRGGLGACGNGCGHSSCSLGGFTLFSRLLAKCKSRHSRCGIFSRPVTAAAIDQCGCGDSGQYFDYAVGAEYGTAGMQSTVAGELTGACCGE